MNVNIGAALLRTLPLSRVYQSKGSVPHRVGKTEGATADFLQTFWKAAVWPILSYRDWVALDKNYSHVTEIFEV